MNKQIEKYNKYSLYFVLGIYALMLIILFLLNSLTLSYICQTLTLSVFIATIFTVLYERWLWKLNPLIKIPILNKEYKGIIEYNNEIDE
ncbi:hypothetical protein [uncultured Methanocorpusculum sp.]|nr:hypothetical protein [uncultured Methanocorpusculum sp.]